MIEKARARTNEDKEARQIEIRDAAFALFHQRDYRDIKIVDVAAKAGVAKGTVYLYYPSKESLFTEIYFHELDRCFDKMAETLQALPRPVRVEAFAEALARGLAASHNLVRMMSMLHTVLEQAMDLDEVVGFKQRVHKKLRAVGETLEMHTDLFQRDEGERFLLRVYAATIGLHQVVAPIREIHDALERVGLSVFNVEFVSELSMFIRGIIREMQRAHLQP